MKILTQQTGIILAGAMLCLAGVSHRAVWAAEPDAGAHPAHSHAASAHAPVAPALDHGRKWTTDEPLRKAMANIRDALEASLNEIHEDRLSAAGYAALGDTIAGQVDFMIRNCQLPPEADAQLHSIIANLLAGADAMKAASAGATRREGAEKAAGALADYGARFDDPAWKPLR